MRKSFPRRRGVVMLWMCMLLLVFIGFMGLALDWGFVVWTGQKLQNAADAAALAGAAKLGDGEVEVNDAAIYLASENEAAGFAVALDRNDEDNVADGEIVVGVYDRDDRSFTPTLSSPNAVRVWARLTEASSHGGTPLFFGPVFGRTTADVSRFAIAMAEGGPNDASIIALNPTDPKSFYLHGTPLLDLGQGSVQVNSSHGTQAGLLQGTTGELIASSMNLVGAFDTKGNPLINFDVNENAPYVPDPLAALPPPDTTLLSTYSRISGVGQDTLVEFQPGVYPLGLKLNAGDNVFLHPGIYVIDTEYTVNGHATLTGYGVMFYIRNGPLRHNGTGETHLTPPADGPYEGISFFQSRTNTNTASFIGTGLMGGAEADGSDGTGVLYFPNAQLQVGGTGDTFAGKLIADKIEVYGTGQKTVVDGYDTDNGLDLIFLVE